MCACDASPAPERSAVSAPAATQCSSSHRVGLNSINPLRVGEVVNAMQRAGASSSTAELWIVHRPGTGSQFEIHLPQGRRVPFAFEVCADCKGGW